MNAVDSAMRVPTSGPTGRVLDELLEPGHLERLQQLATDRAGAYRTARPFPHAVIDDFLPAAVLRKALDAYPGRDELDWQRFDNERERKHAFREVERLPAPVRDVLYFLNTAPVLKFLSTLTGISGLIADPYYSGGGLHQIFRGGLLGIHSDFNKHEFMDLDRRLNLLLFLNEDWPEEYGGHLELWETDMSACVHRILPVFNRCVVFSTTDYSMHGHPNPLTCPEGRSRKSLATYYFSNGRPEHEVSDEHTTVFYSRPGEKTASGPLETAKKLARNLTPPLVYDTTQRLLRRVKK